VKFKKHHGHDEVPRGFQSDGIYLDKWISNRRTDRRVGRLHPEQIAELDKLGFRWSPRKDYWEYAIGLLGKYIKRTKKRHVPVSHVEEGFKLGQWLSAVRSDYKAGLLSQERIDAISKLGIQWKVSRGPASQIR